MNLTTNLKGPKRTYELGDKVLIVGNNEAGKSAITQSLQLAHYGAATDLLFRDEVKLGAALLTMAPPGEGLSIRAEYGTGEKYTYELPRGKKAKHNGVEVVSPGCSDIRTAFSGSVDRMLAYLNKWLEHPEYTLAVEALGTLTGKKKELAAELKECDAALIRAGNPDVVTMDNIRDLICILGFTTVVKSMAKTESIREACKDVSLAYGRDRFEEAKGITVEMIVAKAKAYNEWQQIEKAVRAKDEIEVELLRATQACEKAEKTVAEAAKDMVAEFTEMVADYLHEGESLSIDLDTGYAALNRAGVQHAALSGSTEARVLAAMACALLDPDDVSSLIILDDRMWSEGNLAATMLALREAPGQVIITSTVAVDVPGWQVLRV
jgi:hypothetical protein